MKEKTVFWLFSLIFVSACVIVLLVNDITRRSDEVYVKEITAAEETLGVSAAAEEKAPSGETPELININTATAEELTALPGIGRTIADRIVEYREKNGGFDSTDELTKVNGIGESKLEAVRDMITV
ncbi:MAG: helix-hairpin-helix domain-containing protein [Bacteroides sp.]|nr:helix-hairpin-helix domain-containing protein [Bacteroides sp.]